MPVTDRSRQISFNVDEDVWIFLQCQPNRTRALNDALRLLKAEQEKHPTLEQRIERLEKTVFKAR